MELRLANQHCIGHNIQYNHSGDRLGEIIQKLGRKTFCQTTWWFTSYQGLGQV